MTKLFDENLGSASNGHKLSVLMQKYQQYDPVYVAVSTMTARPEFREFLENIWKQYEPYADTNFIKEFKKQFSQRSWELYLGSTLLNRGQKLGRHSNTGPDIKVPFKFVDVWVEAISVEKGDGHDKVPEVENGDWTDVPEEKMLLRLTSGLMEKYMKYKTYVKNKVISPKDPFVIAIDRSPLEHTDPQVPLILKCLFAIGHQVLYLKRNKPVAQPEGSNWSARDKINKISGSNVEMLMFRDETFEGVSAVIYSDKNILNSPRDREKMGDNLTIVYNPFAKNPLPNNFFKFGESWIQVGSQVKKISSVIKPQNGRT